MDDWHNLKKSLDCLSTSWKYPIVFYDEEVEVGLGKVDFIFTKDCKVIQELTYYDEEDYEQHVSVYCKTLKDYTQMFKMIKQITQIGYILE